jgi:hypothetical protein
MKTEDQDRTLGMDIVPSNLVELRQLHRYVEDSYRDHDEGQASCETKTIVFLQIVVEMRTGSGRSQAASVFDQVAQT